MDIPINEIIVDGIMMKIYIFYLEEKYIFYIRVALNKFYFWIDYFIR